MTYSNTIVLRLIYVHMVNHTSIVIHSWSCYTHSCAENAITISDSSTGCKSITNQRSVYVYTYIQLCINIFICNQYTNPVHVITRYMYKIYYIRTVRPQHHFNRTQMIKILLINIIWKIMLLLKLPKCMDMDYLPPKILKKANLFVDTVVIN